MVEENIQMTKVSFKKTKTKTEKPYLSGILPYLLLLESLIKKSMT